MLVQGVSAYCASLNSAPKGGLMQGVTRLRAWPDVPLDSDRRCHLLRPGPSCGCCTARPCQEPVTACIFHGMGTTGGADADPGRRGYRGPGRSDRETIAQGRLW